ncbi:MAG: zinc ABC transporter substrate-binding protein [Spirochaetales bacterium]|nr:zinc ABC transporter substrate-binding protein [Spirochaetales bacterium]
MKRYRTAFIFILALLISHYAAASGSGEKDQKKSNAKPVIAVSILPQAWFAERIAGDRASTVVLVGPGQNPHSYEPTSRQMTELSRADAWILSKTDFERALLPKISSLYPSLEIVDGTKGVKFRKLESHAHEEETEHESGEGLDIDRHTWLGKEPALIMASQIRDTLVKYDPAGSEFYNGNFKKLEKDINAVFDSLKPVLAPLKGKTVFVYHPAFGYFLDDFGIIQEAVETGGKEPTSKSLSELLRKIDKENVSVIFVQSQFPVNAAKTIASTVGAQVVPLDPLAYDWLSNITLMGNALVKSSGRPGK